ncbi:MAG: 3-dehydroquinate synthase [Balneolaceae bacterium]|nr:MAG: 3-dehydroquinate synthase [Balneolaceae bacterium]
MSRKIINVESNSGTYEVIIGSGIFDEEIGRMAQKSKFDSLFLVIDENVHTLHGDRIITALKKHTPELHLIRVPQGESSKSISFWEKTVGFLLNNGVRRNTPVFVAGGGVTGDLGGFAAATALRGVPLYHIPTTLLAMVDSSIGGKTGINHEMGKNLIGAFYQPERVITDVEFLKTLPSAEWINGLSEILKYAAIRDKTIFSDAEIFFDEVPAAIDNLKLTDLISKCVSIKADIVQQDEFEGGVRAFLNFGHTFAHALERACDYEKLSHGEAVFLGMLAAVKLSNLTGSGLSENHLQKFSSLYHYRVSKEELSYEELIHNMASDKKKTDRFIRFVLLNEWQHPVLKTVKDKALVREALTVVLNEL